MADEVEVEEEAGHFEEGSEQESSVNTKLYFGNLPYSVDSAQLAGIIQEYGSPELIEVFIISFLPSSLSHLLAPTKYHIHGYPLQYKIVVSRYNIVSSQFL